MRIQSIVSYNNKVKNNINKKSSNNKYISTINTKCSGDNFSPAFSGYSAKLLNISKRTESEMEDLAEYFHNRSNDEIRDITRDAHWFNGKNAKNAADRLIEFVTPIREKKLEMVNRISELEIKKVQGISNEEEQKMRLGRKFISLISAEKDGKEPPITNCILIHGNSKNKEGFINWLTGCAGALVKTIQHDSKNSTKTIDLLLDIAESSERAFKHSQTRTLVIVKDLDRMLANKNTSEGMDNINEFKGIVEDISEKYHTTVITKTDKSLDEFEPAINVFKLGVHVDLKDGIKEDELKELNFLKAEVKRLNEKAGRAYSSFNNEDNDF